MEDKIIHSLAVRFADWVNQYVHKDGKDYLKLVFGIEVMIINISKLTIVFAISLLLGSFLETIFVLFGFNFIRRSASGLHAKNGTVCTLQSIGMFILLPYFLRDLLISNWVIFAIFSVIVLLLFLYAPADTDSIPIVGKKKRARLKKNAVISGVVLMLAVLLIPFGNIKTMLTIGAIYEAISILPLSYKLAGRSYNNYKQYEKKIPVPEITT